jgi:hypothetical protein
MCICCPPVGWPARQNLFVDELASFAGTICQQTVAELPEFLQSGMVPMNPIILQTDNNFFAETRA